MLAHRSEDDKRQADHDHEGGVELALRQAHDGMRARVRHHLRTMQDELEQGIEPAAVTEPSPGEATSTPDCRATESALADSFATLLQFSGGPVQWYAYTGNFGGAAEAQNLIALIQATIAPAHWDVNDGPGHIHYYAPQALLVIRAGMDQHAEVGDLLHQLRDQQ